MLPAAQEAVVERRAPICMTQLSKTSEPAGQLAKLKAMNQWDQPEFVAENCWATMPGTDSANSLVARECAQRLAVLET
jgi:hypothetical protein